MRMDWLSALASVGLAVLVSVPAAADGPRNKAVPSVRPVVSQDTESIRDDGDGGIEARTAAFEQCDDACAADACDACAGGDPLELFPESDWGLKVGGWFQAGYNNKSDGKFNNVPGKVNVHQAYLYAQKVADGECGLDWGFRTDLMYGVDGYDAQAFGSNPGTWDFKNGFDHGIYAWAMPQAYAELALHDLSVKLGHFYTPVGYEVVTSPDNFFFSHAFTMYNSEPFTHTGALGTYAASDKLTLYGGWTLGWDTGFDSYQGGSNFLGGFGYAITEDISMTYINCIGDLGWRGQGYNHSLVFNVTLTEKLNYVFQTDFVGTDTATANDDLSINQYLFYALNDCWKFGTRVEWWQRDGESLWEATVGVNWRPHPNFILRPEIKYNSGEALVNLGLPDESTIFGIDAILTF
ncbi:MAG: porin [Pirellulaceae bacterium]|nr:porin [Pirellulaceae bacterium]